MEIHLHFPAVTTLDLDNWLDACQLLDAIYRNTERLIKMSETNQEQVLALLADMNTKLDGVVTEITEVGADVDSLIASMEAGNQITPEIIASLTMVRDRIATVADNAAAVNAKVPPV